MAAWLKLLIFVLLVGITKAHHIKLLVLAILGLAGLWMFQSFSESGGGGGGGKSLNLNTLFPNFNPASIATRIFSKRSIPDYEYAESRIIEDNPNIKKIDWDKILKNDPSTCARSFVCQLSATPINDLNNEEIAMLNLIRSSRFSEKSTTNGNKQLLIAVQNGETVKNRNQCRKIYKKCPYSSKTMLFLIKFFGNQVQ